MPGLDELDTSHVFLLGIAGAGQYPLAEMLLDIGCKISGSDLKPGENGERLRQRGVTVYEGHDPSNLKDATLLVTTAASTANNPELIEAQARGIRTLTNAQMVALLVNSKRCLAIAGTHGKTTTTNLVAALLSRAELEPTFYIGGISRDLGCSGGMGKGEYAVVEADEYARRFLEYRPDAALVNNIEGDHLDYYGDFETLKAAFHQFATQSRRLFFCADEPNARLMGEQFLKERGSGVYLYGLDGMADWRAANIESNSLGGNDFTLWQGKNIQARVSLALPGLHNVSNAVGALAMCITAAPHIPPAKFCELISEFQGTARRFEVKGEKNGVLVVDDYAHHPTEIMATLASARQRYSGRRLVALFQPHTHRRTKTFLNEFAAAFTQADRVLLMEIFRTRETDTLGVSSEDILSLMQHPGKVTQVVTYQNASVILKEILQPGDVLLMLGAGDIWKIADLLL
ncbi:MAG: UDP-N-acetylmuramate--L-alanine ligase [Chloroflexi bacterium]|uniref:UDP-N-acetylmuramate--L-alanine ligase n=1 Tax=Candidatus Chlorohelix allophototropha TaxID=3003348 RepID=A0A8T7LZP8_9CHLR|nr:UDP-N-acetylmuramate--L-alanine ligase [Chloroflexota bacterium]WJW66364.1 UDP-N-acetylmuramate--L-alanine ligase [Chloroflexota bacterium L227-S17]